MSVAIEEVAPGGPELVQLGTHQRSEMGIITTQTCDLNEQRPYPAQPLLGAIVGSFASVSDQTLGYILCIYSGFFLYMGATDLLPEAHAHASWRKVGLTASGFALIFAITRVAGV